MLQGRLKLMSSKINVAKSAFFVGFWPFSVKALRKTRNYRRLNLIGHGHSNLSHIVFRELAPEKFKNISAVDQSKKMEEAL